MTGRGWTDEPFELLKIRLLDHVVEATADGRISAVQTYADDLGADARQLVAAGKALADEGLLSTESSLGAGLYAHPTDHAAAVIESRAARRTNPKLRAAACREALLDWCYVRDAEGYTPSVVEFGRDVRAHFEGDSFSDDEVARASRDLKERSLITGEGSFGGPVARPQITAEGKVVVESYDGVIQHNDTRQGQAAPVVNFHGNVSGQVAIGNANQLNQQSSSSADLQVLLTAVLSAAAGTREEEQVGRLVTAVQLEADQDEPDADIITKNVQRLQAVGQKVGGAALTVAVGNLVDWASRGLGLS